MSMLLIRRSSLCQYHEMAAEAFYLMAMVYNKLGRLEEREEAADSFKKYIMALENPEEGESSLFNISWKEVLCLMLFLYIFMFIFLHHFLFLLLLHLRFTISDHYHSYLQNVISIVARKKEPLYESTNRSIMYFIEVFIYIFVNLDKSLWK